MGSNIGNARRNIDRAIEEISNMKNFQLINIASFYQTKAWGHTNQADFINTVIEITTELQPETLLTVLQGVEQNMGRVRNEKWGPRIIDIDILLYGNNVVKQPQLTIPHPYLTVRNFVLIPLAELNYDLEIPKQGKLKEFINKKSLSNDIVKII